MESEILEEKGFIFFVNMQEMKTLNPLTLGIYKLNRNKY